MKRWIRLIARLYPTGWRDRYGAEFDALLEEASPIGTDVLDVLRGVLAIHLKTWSFPKIAVVCGLTGALIAAGVAFRMPDKYVSTAVLEVGSADETAVSENLKQLVFSRAYLAELIRKEDLYPADRGRIPFEDVIERLRHDIRLESFKSAAGDPKRAALTVQFVYGNPGQAQRIARGLIAKIIEANVTAIRAETATNRRPVGRDVEVLDPASLPRERASPNRLMITAVGVGMGLLIAALAGVAIRLRASGKTAARALNGSGS